RGADYIGIGPVFATPTKPEYKQVGLELLAACGKKIKIPYFAIGGINQANLDRVISSGAKRAAVCRAIIKAKNIRKTVKEFNLRLNPF
ncbi:MAG: thiamine phosphate synthase, partial [Candidatus Omnitrophica bacterium]|nr:thiamine phosphate synthase [Candidatus Omnitrophota bacterium]